MSDWPEDIFLALVDAGIRQVAYVPDAGHARLIERCRASPDMRAVPLTTEEEGVSLLGGAWLGGERGVLLIQSSGVGNCINMLAMTRTCRFPLLMIVTMRGQWREFNPWQVPMGQTTARALETAGVVVETVAAAADVGPMVGSAAGMAFAGQVAIAVLLHQRLMQVKSFGR